MWKLMKGVITETLHEYLDENILPEKQKGCCKGSRGTKGQLSTDKGALRDCRRRHTNLAIAWINYGKVYAIVPPSWIVKSISSLTA